MNVRQGCECIVLEIAGEAVETTLKVEYEPDGGRAILFVWDVVGEDSVSLIPRLTRDEYGHLQELAEDLAQLDAEDRWLAQQEAARND